MSVQEITLRDIKWSIEHISTELMIADLMVKSLLVKKV